MACCSDCGKSFDRVGSGRPRKRCYECAPPKVAPKGDVDLSCSFCNAEFRGRANAKYCSVSCQDDAREHRRGADCAGCSKRIVRSRTSADVQWCLSCRRAGLAPSSARHGTSSRYRKGCRCDECKGVVAKKQRDYAARRKAAGNKINYSSYRSTVPAVCEQCSISFLSRTDDGVRRFCSLGCANDFQGRNDSPRIAFKIAKSARLAIYEAAGWACSLCKCPTRPDEDSNHPRYPTLDHVQPRSLGGGDELENLRLACRQCNTLRGNNVDWVPELSEVRDESSREVA